MKTSARGRRTCCLADARRSLGLSELDSFCRLHLWLVVVFSIPSSRILPFQAKHSCKIKDHSMVCSLDSRGNLGRTRMLNINIKYL